MEKGNKIYVIIIVVCALLVIGLCAYAIYNHEDIVISDAQKFKEEYEAYNGLVNESNEKNYLNVEIPSENPIVYKTGKEILDVLKNETAIVYFGYASEPVSRSMIEVLLAAAQEKNVSKIYYVNIYAIRDTYIFSGSIIPEQTQKGTDAYYEILAFLKDYLEEYYVKDDAGNMYDTGVTRLYAPSVVAVSGGSVVKFHEGTIDSQEDPYVALTDSQKEELKEIYLNIFDSIKVNQNACSSSEAC